MATGTIENEDPLQRAWLARFGRTEAQRVFDGVQGRLRSPHETGIHATLAGYDLGVTGEAAVKDRFQALPEWSGGEEAGCGQSLRR